MLVHASDCSTISDEGYLFSLNGCLFKIAVLRSGLSEKETYISNTGGLYTDSARIWEREKHVKRQRVLKYNRKWLRAITGAFVSSLNCISSNCKKKIIPLMRLISKLKSKYLDWLDEGQRSFGSMNTAYPQSPFHILVCIAPKITNNN